MYRTALALTLLASPLAAQDEDFSLFAPGGTCLGQELIVSLAADRFGIGETSCQIESFTPNGDWTDVALTGCQSEGEPSEDRTYSFRLTGGDTLELRYGDGYEASLQLCTDL